ncbi:hypothetical protein Hanom_Chr16g01486361 [Helianthus anomalus]
MFFVNSLTLVPYGPYHLKFSTHDSWAYNQGPYHLKFSTRGSWAYKLDAIYDLYNYNRIDII